MAHTLRSMFAFKDIHLLSLHLWILPWQSKNCKFTSNIVNAFSLMTFLATFFFCLVHFIVEYIIHITYKICVNQLFSSKALGDFCCGPVIKNPPSNAGDMGSIPGQETRIPRSIVTKPMQQLEKPACLSEDPTWPKTKKQKAKEGEKKSKVFGQQWSLSKVWVGDGVKSYMWIVRVCVRVCACMCVRACVYVCMRVCACVHLVAPWCLTLCHPMDCGPPGSSVYGIFLARIPEWVVLATDWCLLMAVAACLCRDWILCCCSCWPATCLEGSSGWRVRHSVLQGNWWSKPLDSQIFSETDFMIQIHASPHI